MRWCKSKSLLSRRAATHPVGLDRTKVLNIRLTCRYSYSTHFSNRCQRLTANIALYNHRMAHSSMQCWSQSFEIQMAHHLQRWNNLLNQRLLRSINTLLIKIMSTANLKIVHEEQSQQPRLEEEVVAVATIRVSYRPISRSRRRGRALTGLWLASFIQKTLAMQIMMQTACSLTIWF